MTQPSRSVAFSFEPLPGLRQLSDSVYLHEPPDSMINVDFPPSPVVNQALDRDEGVITSPSASVGSAGPKLIILVTWMGAAPRHILKYVAGYQSLYPAARLLLIRSSAPDLFWRPRRVQQRRIQPSFHVIDSTCGGHSSNSSSSSSSSSTRSKTNTTTKPNQPEILIHIYSNGGSHQACNLFRTYLARTSQTLPPHVTILDSCPGRGTFSRSMRAISSVLPPSLFLRIPLYIFFNMLLCLYWLAYIPLDIPDPIERVRRDLNDASLMSEVRRCYIYSDEDPMVDFHDVELHASEAARRGFTVQSEKFHGSGHCAHVRVGSGARYWDVVRNTWLDAHGGGDGSPVA